MHPGNTHCWKPHILRGGWEAQFKDLCCCRDSSTEHVACGKQPCRSNKGLFYHLRGVSKSINFTRTSEVDPFTFSTPGGFHLEERMPCGTVIYKSRMCCLASMRDGYGHVT